MVGEAARLSSGLDSQNKSLKTLQSLEKERALLGKRHSLLLTRKRLRR